jgi:uncharacterized protein YdiU (UPF0061 family)
MSQTNPRVIPRIHQVEHVLERAAAGEWRPWTELLEALRSPFADSLLHQRFRAPAPVEFSAEYCTFCGT